MPHGYPQHASSASVSPLCDPLGSGSPGFLRLPSLIYLTQVFVNCYEIDALALACPCDLSSSTSQRTQWLDVLRAGKVGTSPGKACLCFVRALARGLPKSHDLPECTWPTGLHQEESSPDRHAAALLSAQSVDSDHTGATAQLCPWSLGRPGQASR